MSRLKQKKGTSPLISRIQNGLGTKFQLKETILNFWTKFSQNIWALSTSFAKTAQTLFGPFLKKVLQSVLQTEKVLQYSN